MRDPYHYDLRDPHEYDRRPLTGRDPDKYVWWQKWLDTGTEEPTPWPTPWHLRKPTWRARYRAWMDKPRFTLHLAVLTLGTPIGTLEFRLPYKVTRIVP